MSGRTAQALAVGDGRAAPHYNRSRLRRASAGVIIVRRCGICAAFSPLVAAGSAPPLAAQQSPAPAAPEGTAAYYFLLGRHLEGEDKIDDAIAAHKQAIALEPASAELRAELAGLYARQDRARRSRSTWPKRRSSRIRTTSEANRILGSIYAALAEQRQPMRPGDNPCRVCAAGHCRARKGAGATVPSTSVSISRSAASTCRPARSTKPSRFSAASSTISRGTPDGAMPARGSAGRRGESRRCDRRRWSETLQENPNFFRGQLRLAELYERSRRGRRRPTRYARAQTAEPASDRARRRRAAALINAGKTAEGARSARRACWRVPSRRPDPAVAVPPRRGAARRQGSAGRRSDGAEAARSRAPDDPRGLHVLSLDPAGARATSKAAERNAPRHRRERPARRHRAQLARLHARRARRAARRGGGTAAAGAEDRARRTRRSSTRWAGRISSRAGSSWRIPPLDAGGREAAGRAPSSRITSAICASSSGASPTPHRRGRRALAGDGQSIDRGEDREEDPRRTRPPGAEVSSRRVTPDCWRCDRLRFRCLSACCTQAHNRFRPAPVRRSLTRPRAYARRDHRVPRREDAERGDRAVRPRRPARSCAARIVAGFAAPAQLRLEAPAPFGRPVFVLVARGQDATLVLYRDGRVLRGAPPDADCRSARRRGAGARRAARGGRRMRLCRGRRRRRAICSLESGPRSRAMASPPGCSASPAPGARRGRCSRSARDPLRGLRVRASVDGSAYERSTARQPAAPT